MEVFHIGKRILKDILEIWD